MHGAHNKTNGKEETAHDHVPKADLTVDVLGVAMFLPKQKRVILVDGRKPRLSVNDPSTIIPAHLPIIAFEPRKYRASTVSKGKVRRVPSRMSFDYDLSGQDDEQRFDAFLLDGHTVTFENVQARGSVKPEDESIASMKSLAGKLTLCSDVIAGKAKEVVATINLSNAATIIGEAHGNHSEHTLRFGHEEKNCAEKVTSRFVRKKNEQPVVCLTNENGDNVMITLTGGGPWTVMIANVPAEELINMNSTPEGRDVPLTHVELLYDFYHLGRNDPRPIPRCTDHRHAHAHSTDGHCGPPVKP